MCCPEPRLAPCVYTWKRRPLSKALPAHCHVGLPGKLHLLEQHRPHPAWVYDIYDVAVALPVRYGQAAAAHRACYKHVKPLQAAPGHAGPNTVCCCRMYDTIAAAAAAA